MRACIFVRLFHQKTHIRLQFEAPLSLADLEQKSVALAIIYRLFIDKLKVILHF